MSKKNVLGTELQSCCKDPMTGFYRDGFCKTGEQDVGTHVACAIMTEEFLKYTKAKGNDLSTPRPGFGFAGLQPGDRWCLCAARFRQAHDEGCAPQVDLSSTHRRALDIVSLDILRAHAIP